MIDVESLLQPISESAPCGEDLSFAAELDAIQEYRRADDPTLDQGEWVTEIKSANWDAVSEQCSILLKERSKDLRVAAWLAEAQVHLHGFAGLTDGYRLSAQLCERFWDGLYPELNDEDHELRVGNLAWLLSQSVGWIRGIPMTESSQGRYGQVDFEAARGGHAGASGEVMDIAQLEAARANTPYAFYLRLAEEAPACMQALEELQAVVDARLGVDGPSFGATRDALDNAVHMALRFARDAGVHSDASGDMSMDGDENNASAAATGGAAPVTVANGEISSRREALAQLRRVAEFFRRTEPHSPVAYLADKAARWGTMPLHVWLRSVVKDGGSLAHLEEMLDVGQDEQGES